MTLSKDGLPKEPSQNSTDTEALRKIIVMLWSEALDTFVRFGHERSGQIPERPDDKDIQ